MTFLSIAFAIICLIAAAILRIYNPEIRNYFKLSSNANIKINKRGQYELFINKKATKIVCFSIEYSKSLLQQFSINQKHEKLKIYDTSEAIRRIGYGNKINETFAETFFDNSDMEDKNYFLHVVFDEGKNKGILTARSYCDKELVLKEIDPPSGGFYAIDFNTNIKTKESSERYLHSKPNANFAIDRMAEDITGKTYHNIPEYLMFALLYKSIINTHKNQQRLFALARFSETQYLLTKYLKLGLRIIGISDYKVGNSNKLHWCLTADIAELKVDTKKQVELMEFIFQD